MARYRTTWHGPGLVSNDFSNTKVVDYSSSSVRKPWYRHTDSDGSILGLTKAIAGTVSSTSDADIAQYAITTTLQNPGNVSDTTKLVISA